MNMICQSSSLDNAVVTKKEKPQWLKTTNDEGVHGRCLAYLRHSGIKADRRLQSQHMTAKAE